MSCVIFQLHVGFVDLDLFYLMREGAEMLLYCKGHSSRVLGLKIIPLCVLKQGFINSKWSYLCPDRVDTLGHQKKSQWRSSSSACRKMSSGRFSWLHEQLGRWSLWSPGECGTAEFGWAPGWAAACTVGCCSCVRQWDCLIKSCKKHSDKDKHDLTQKCTTFYENKDAIWVLFHCVILICEHFNFVDTLAFNRVNWGKIQRKVSCIGHKNASDMFLAKSFSFVKPLKMD